MKKYLIVLFCLLGFISASISYADSPTGAGTMNTITEVINSMATSGIIEADVAKYKIGYYSDQIFLYGTELTSVLKASEDWERSELWNVISKRLYSLKDQWFLSKEKYESYINSYTGIISTGSTLQLGSVYKDFVRLEKEIINTEIPRTQEALYNTYKERLMTLLKERKITQDKYNTWHEKIKLQVYQYKSDPDLMSLEFEEEAARHTTVIESIPDYTSEIKARYGKLYAKMSIKSLQLTLKRTKKLEKKYAEGSKNKLKALAQIDLLNQEIAKKLNSSSPKR